MKKGYVENISEEKVRQEIMPIYFFIVLFLLKVFIENEIKNKVWNQKIILKINY